MVLTRARYHRAIAQSLGLLPSGLLCNQMRPWASSPAWAPHWRCTVKIWSASLAGFFFIASGACYLSLDLPAEISWAPWGCIAGGLCLLTTAGIRARIG
jgi:hypothetical protein